MLSKPIGTMSDEFYPSRRKGARIGMTKGCRSKEDKPVMPREEIQPIHHVEALDPPQGNQLHELTLVAGVLSVDANSQLETAKDFRKMLTQERRSPYMDYLQSKMIPYFVEFLKKDEFPLLQVEAAEILMMITAGSSELTRLVIDHGMIPLFDNLFNSPNKEVCAKAVWLLGNIARDSPMSRDLLLNHGVLDALLVLMDKLSTLPGLAKATWTLAALCDCTPKPPFEQVKPAYSMLQRLIYLDDDEVLGNACLSLCYLTHEVTDEKIQPLVEDNVCPRLVELLLHPSRIVLAPAVHLMRNIVTVDKLQAQCIIDHGGLPHLVSILTRYFIMEIIKEDACFIISSITSGTQDQIQAVIDAKLIEPLVNLLATAEFDVKKEALSAIFNVITGGTHDQIRSVVLTGCIKPLCDLLESRDLDIISMCLKSVNRIFRVGELEKKTMEDRNLYAQLTYEAGGLDKIENMHFHDNPEISEQAVKISETYDRRDDEEV